jgi:hypothetical protein
VLGLDEISALTNGLQSVDGKDFIVIEDHLGIGPVVTGHHAIWRVVTPNSEYVETIDGSWKSKSMGPLGEMNVQNSREVRMKLRGLLDRSSMFNIVVNRESIGSTPEGSKTFGGSNLFFSNEDMALPFLQRLWYRIDNKRLKVIRTRSVFNRYSRVN